MKATASQDPFVAELLRADLGLKPRLLRIKFQRMSANPFAFFRGADPLFAKAWPELKPPDVGPAILICGDLHLENFGAYRTETGDFRFGLNDFDEALVAPCSLDVVRCTASILLASEQWRLTPTQATGMALAFLDSYRESVRDPEPGEVAPESGQGAVWDLLADTAVGLQIALLDRVTLRNRSGKRTIRSAVNHPKIGRERAKIVRQAIDDYLAQRSPEHTFRVLDLSGRVAGVGSLGVRRYLALVGDGKNSDVDCLLDVKECNAPALLSCSTFPQPNDEDDAHRVISAQEQLQGTVAAGLGTLVIGKRSYRVREMIPDEHRASLDRLRHRPDLLRDAVWIAGRLTAWSQLRGAKILGQDHTPELLRWSAGPSLDAVLASAARVADRTNHDFAKFQLALSAGGLGTQAAR